MAVSGRNETNDGEEVKQRPKAETVDHRVEDDESHEVANPHGSHYHTVAETSDLKLSKNYQDLAKNIEHFYMYFMSTFFCAVILL